MEDTSRLQTDPAGVALQLNISAPRSSVQRSLAEAALVLHPALVDFISKTYERDFHHFGYNFIKIDANMTYENLKSIIGAPKSELSHEFKP